MTLISLLIYLVLIGLVWWSVRALGDAFGIPAPIMAVIQVFFVVLIILYLLQVFGAGIRTLPSLRL